MAKRAGRPLKTHAAGTEVTVSVLMPAELKTKLQDHAVDAKRTLSAEAQLRLQQSMQTTGRAGLLPDALQLAFGELGGIVLLVAIAMERGGRFAAWKATDDLDVWMGDRWLTVPEAYDAAVQLAHYVLESARPAGKAVRQDPPFDCADLISDYIGRPAANAPPYALDIRHILSQATAKRMRAYRPTAMESSHE
jgi:hypothetical protein